MTGHSIPRRADSTGDGPLSYAQEGIWLTEQAFPEFARYTGVRAFRLLGSLDTRALARAVVQLGGRHEALLTTVTVVNGVPRQTVRAGAELPLEQTDLRNAADPRAAALAYVDGAAQSRFDLSADPLFRCVLLRTATDAWVLLLVAHHIVIDLLSWPILLTDLGELYRAEIDGTSAELTPLPIRPADYAEWQRGRTKLPEVQKQVAYWRRALADIPPLLDLPVDRRRSPVRRRAGSVLHVDLPPETADGLMVLGRSAGTTLLATSLAALGVLLSRYTRQARTTIGLPVAGDRFRPEVENLVGMFVGSFPVPVDVGGVPTFRQLLDRTKQAVFGAMTNQDAPYELLMEALQPERCLGTVPYQQVSLNIRYPHKRRFTLTGLEVSAIPAQHWFPLGDLTLTVDASSDPVGLFWIYDSELLEESTVAAMAEQYSTLLAEAAHDPDRPVDELGMVYRNHTIAPETSPLGTVHARFAAQARRAPDSPAVVHGSQRLTYGQLDRCTDVVAQSLRSHGVRHGDRVGVCLPRSADLVVAYLAILKAGGAYVPLDPGYPDHRLAEMLQLCGARIAITAPSAADGPWSDGVKTLGVEELSAPRHEVPLTDIGHRDSLAYVMFTSGSTGSPKGVEINHRGVLGLVVDANHVEVGPGDRVAQTAGLCSDNTTFEVWAPLLNGASVHILDCEVVMSPRRLGAELAAERITILSLASALVNHEAYLAPLASAPLKALYFGGEAGNPHAVRRLLEQGFPGTAVHTYGPTETTMLATYEPVSRLPDACVRIPVGAPVSATEVYVMDDRLRPLPLGVPGELCVAGDRLARGYADRPALTAERFCPHPIPGRAGQRIYRTGDLARELPDGRFEILGRLDRQVKIRGFRIEPGEVEAVLLSLPDIAEAVVVALPVSDDRLGLVGYVSPEPGREPSLPALLRTLRERLPEHMVPSSVVVLPRLPLTPSGKVDQGALPPPAPRPAHRVEADTLTPGERLIADIVTDLLGLETIGRNDEFRDLGGTSLFLVQLLTRLEEHGFDVPIGDITAHRTVGELATALSHGGGWPSGDIGSAAPTLVLVGIEGAGFSYGPWISALQNRYQRRLVDVDGISDRSLTSLAADHVEQLRRSLSAAPVAFAGWSAGGVLAHEMARIWHERVGGLPPVLMIDSTAYASREQASVPDLLATFLHDLSLSTGIDTGPLPHDLDRRTPGEVLSEALAFARARGAGHLLDANQLLTRYQAFVETTRLVGEHTPRRYAGPGCFVQAEDSHPQAADWQALCGALQVVTLSGNHYTVLRTSAARLAELGEELLRSATPASPAAPASSVQS
ncbi:amino acid adenylation domain-containing protein [Streptomyces sp. NPDC050164]|uniref:amino acid adenylation domain-containing protein n=1 Tax=Streptomyces sp. NPDC050164 TaxID=3365605 RepID=UPI0037B16C27